MFFALSDDKSRLILRTRRGSEILELIPHEKFAGDLPTLLIEGYTHWLNLSTGQIELRPLVSLWNTSPKNWRIHFSATSSKMVTDTSRLMIDIHSDSFKMISNLLHPLEYDEFLTITTSEGGESLSIDLPRFNLSFFMNGEGLLECQNMPHMVIDSNQSPGTMFGLASQLVLRDKTQQSSTSHPRSRKVLIPVGEIQFERHMNHVMIHIDTKSQNQRRVLYHDYVIDTDLGCLVGNIGLATKLYKVYLHALSNHCLSDPLTQRTGTEEALQEYESAGCMSLFRPLSSVEEDLLRKLDALSPTRNFFSRQAEVQNVQWLNLPPNSQHYAFQQRTRSIVEYAEQIRVFLDDSEVHGDTDLKISELVSSKSSHLLISRAAHRHAAFYPADTSSPLSSTPEDLPYEARDVPSPAEVDAYEYARMVDRAIMEKRLVPGPKQPPLYKTFKQWVHVTGVAGRKSGTLAYDRNWLSPDLSKIWMSAYSSCRSSTTSGRDERFRLLFSLPSMAYGSPATRDFIPYLLAFAVDPQFIGLIPPQYATYNISAGTSADRPQILKLIKKAAYPLEESPSYTLARLPGETEGNFWDRRESHYDAEWKTDAERIVNHIMRQGDCAEPTFLTSRHIDMSKCMEGVKALYGAWYKNHKLKTHIGLVQDTLKDIFKKNGNRMDVDPKTYNFVAARNPSHPLHCSISFEDLLQRPAPPPELPSRVSFWKGINFCGRDDGFIDTDELESLLGTFTNSSEKLRQQYGYGLDASRVALSGQPLITLPGTLPCSEEKVVEYRDNCVSRHQAAYDKICEALGPSTPVEKMIYKAGQWPRLTRKYLLSKLARSSDSTMTIIWRRTLTIFGRELLEYQRSQRLLDMFLSRKHEDFLKEFQNHPFDIQNAMENPDWLLIQVSICFTLYLSATICTKRYTAGKQLHRQDSPTTSCQGDDQSDGWLQYSSAAQHGGREIVRDCSYGCLCTVRWHKACPGSRFEVTGRTDVPSAGRATDWPDEPTHILYAIFAKDEVGHG